MKPAGWTRQNVKNEEYKTMKMINTLLFAGVVVGGLALVPLSRADVAASPRVQANQIKRISSTEAGPNLVSGDYLGAAAKASAMFQSTVSGSTDNGPSLVSGNYLGAAAKSPTYEARPAQFEIAPVVEKANSCQPASCQGKQGQPSCCHGK